MQILVYSIRIWWCMGDWLVFVDVKYLYYWMMTLSCYSIYIELYLVDVCAIFALFCPVSLHLVIDFIMCSQLACLLCPHFLNGHQ